MRPCCWLESLPPSHACSSGRQASSPMQAVSQSAAWQGNRTAAGACCWAVLRVRLMPRPCRMTCTTGCGGLPQRGAEAIVAVATTAATMLVWIALRDVAGCLELQCLPAGQARLLRQAPADPGNTNGGGTSGELPSDVEATLWHPTVSICLHGLTCTCPHQICCTAAAGGTAPVLRRTDHDMSHVGFRAAHAEEAGACSAAQPHVCLARRSVQRCKFDDRRGQRQLCQ